MEILFQHIRYGIRSLLKRPGFTSIAVLTLALGIGACTAIFSVVDGVLLRSLPYPEAERIVQLREINSAGTQVRFTEPNFLDVRARSRTLEGVAEYSGEQRPLLEVASLPARLPFECQATFSVCSVHSRFLAAPSLWKKVSRAARRWRDQLRLLAPSAGWKIRLNRNHAEDLRQGFHRCRSNASRFWLPAKRRGLDPARNIWARNLTLGPQLARSCPRASSHQD